MADKRVTSFVYVDWFGHESVDDGLEHLGLDGLAKHGETGFRAELLEVSSLVFSWNSAADTIKTCGPARDDDIGAGIGLGQNRWGLGSNGLPSPQVGSLEFSRDCDVELPG